MNMLDRYSYLIHCWVYIKFIIKGLIYLEARRRPNKMNAESRLEIINKSSRFNIF